jgi:hypothetical protein
MRVLHVGDCSIPDTEMFELVQAVLDHGKIEVLCGVPIELDNSVIELDISGKCKGAEGALVLLRHMEEGRACSLESIDVSNSSLRSQGAELILSALHQGNFSRSVPQENCTGLSNHPFLLCTAKLKV